jgi:hypothetical protein
MFRHGLQDKHDGILQNNFEKNQFQQEVIPERIPKEF